jgi:hypothetical protein
MIDGQKADVVVPPPADQTLHTLRSPRGNTMPVFAFPCLDVHLANALKRRLRTRLQKKTKTKATDHVQLLNPFDQFRVSQRSKRMWNRMVHTRIKPFLREHLPPPRKEHSEWKLEIVNHVVNYYNPSAYRELHTDVDERGDAQLFTTVLLTLSSDLEGGTFFPQSRTSSNGTAGLIIRPGPGTCTAWPSQLVPHGSTATAYQSNRVNLVVLLKWTRRIVLPDVASFLTMGTFGCAAGGIMGGALGHALGMVLLNADKPNRADARASVRRFLQHVQGKRDWWRPAKQLQPMMK